MAHSVGIATEIHEDDLINMGHKIDSKKLHALVRAMQTGKSGDSLQILAKAAGIKYNSKFNVLTDQAGNQILPSKLLEWYGFRESYIGCIHCYQNIKSNVIFLHLNHGYQQGHKFNHSKTVRFFTDETNGIHEKIRNESKHFPNPSAPRSHY